MVCEACSQGTNTEARFCCHCGKPMGQQQTAWGKYAGRLTRPREGRMLGGVCLGISQAYGFDPVLVRILAVVLLFCGIGTIAIAYIAAWIIMPNAPLYYPPVTPMDGFAGSASA